MMSDVIDEKLDSQNELVLRRRNFDRVYWFVIATLLMITLVAAIFTVKQTQMRHQTYQQIAQLRSDIRALQIEEERLIIEQQTFSSTPTVAKRSAIELKMFYPDGDHRLVLSSTAPNKTASE